jgi:hypothetical protein
VSGWITQPLEGNHIASALKNVLKEKVQFDRRGLMVPSSTSPRLVAVLAAAYVDGSLIANGTSARLGGVGLALQIPAARSLPEATPHADAEIFALAKECLAADRVRKEAAVPLEKAEDRCRDLVNSDRSG